MTKVDVLRAETAIKAAQRQLAMAQQNRENAVSRLRADLDIDGDDRRRPPGQPLPRRCPTSRRSWRAPSTRGPTSSVAQNNVRIAELEVRKQRGFWLPTVTFDGGCINQKSAFPASQVRLRRVALHRADLQSGEVEARVAQAKEREEQAKLEPRGREDRRARGRAPGARRPARRGDAPRRSRASSSPRPRRSTQQTFELYRAQEATSLDVAVVGDVARRRAPRRGRGDLQSRSRRSCASGTPRARSKTAAGSQEHDETNRSILIAIIIALRSRARRRSRPPATAKTTRRRCRRTCRRSPRRHATPTRPPRRRRRASRGVATEAGGTIVATGEFVSPVRSELAAKLPGRVAKMYVDEGSRCRRASRCSSWRPTTRASTCSAPRPTPRAPKAAEEDAERDLDRKKELIAKDSIPRATYDRSQSDVRPGAGGARSRRRRRRRCYRQQLDRLGAALADRRRGRREAHRRRPAPRRRHASRSSSCRRRRSSSASASRSAISREVARGQTVKATRRSVSRQIFDGQGDGRRRRDRSRRRARSSSRPSSPTRDGRLRPGLFARGRVWRCGPRRDRSRTMHKLAELCVRRPVFATVLILSLVVVGLLRLPAARRRPLPEGRLPDDHHHHHLAGAAPEEIETEITDKIEEAVNTISGIDQLQSTSSEGVSLVIVQFVLEKDTDVAAQEVRDKVNTHPRRPAEGRRSADHPEARSRRRSRCSRHRPLRPGADPRHHRVRRQEAARGAWSRSTASARSRIVGGRPRQINVVADTEKLDRRGPDHGASVVDALQTQNVQIPGGKVEQGLRDLTLRTYGRVADAGRVRERLPITSRNGYPVQGRRRRPHRGQRRGRRSRSPRVDGKPAVVLQIRKQSGTNTDRGRRTAQGAPRRAAEASCRRAGRCEIVRDQSDYIVAAVDAVKEHLILGSLFAALIVWFFLSSPKLKTAAALVLATLAVYFLLFGFHDVRRDGGAVARGRRAGRVRHADSTSSASRPTIISAVAIPSSIIATFAAMQLQELHAQRHHAAGADAGGRHRHRRRRGRAGEHLPLHGREEAARRARRRSRGRRRSASRSGDVAVADRGVPAGGLHGRHRRPLHELVRRHDGDRHRGLAAGRRSR